jgi:hypothetical protein
MVLPLSPKETPLEFEKTTLPRLSLETPAEKFTGDGAPAGTLTTTLPPVIPIEARPSPLKIKEEALDVPEEL